MEESLFTIFMRKAGSYDIAGAEHSGTQLGYKMNGSVLLKEQDFVKGQWTVDRIPPDRFFSLGIELVF